jgi:hypothetical protein
MLEFAGNSRKRKNNRVFIYPSREKDHLELKKVVEEKFGDGFKTYGHGINY